MNLVEYAHLKRVYDDMLVARLLMPIYNQVMELYSSLDYKYHNLELVFSELAGKEATYFQEAQRAVVTEDVERLLQLAVKAQHVLVNKGLNNVPVMTSLELLSRLYKAIFQELLESLDLIYHRSLKTRKVVMKVIKRNILGLAARVVPLLDSPPETAVQPSGNILLANQQLDDLLNKTIAQQKEIQLGAPEPLPISPLPSAAASAAASATASASAPADLKEVIAAATSEKKGGSDDQASVKEFRNYN